MENRIRELRKNHNLTMKKLGEELGLSESTISQYETGKRNPDNETLLKMGDIFGVSVGYILGNNDDLLPPELYVGIGKKIEAAAAEAKIPANILLSKIGITSKTTADMLAGKYPFSMKTISQVADVLGKRVQFFLSEESSRNEIEFDGFTYAMYSEGKELTPENQKKLIELAKFFKEQQEKEKK